MHPIQSDGDVSESREHWESSIFNQEYIVSQFECVISCSDFIMLSLKTLSLDSDIP